MEGQVDRLVDKAWGKFKQTPRSQRLMLAVSGIPGSGKTTLAALVTKKLNERYRTESPAGTATEAPAAFVPMDGYHLTRAQLSAMPDPDTAHARRGADFTFDAPSFLKLVKKLREPLCAESATVYAPSFDHAKKDPVEDDIPIHPTARLVVFEGLYLSLGTGAKEWKEAAELMDELWFAEVDIEVARRRLIRRHIQSGLADDEASAAKRADENDLVNGRQIIDGRIKVDEVIVSKDDYSWSTDSAQ